MVVKFICLFARHFKIVLQETLNAIDYSKFIFSLNPQLLHILAYVSTIYNLERKYNIKTVIGQYTKKRQRSNFYFNPGLLRRPQYKKFVQNLIESDRAVSKVVLYLRHSSAGVSWLNIRIS